MLFVLKVRAWASNVVTSDSMQYSTTKRNSVPGLLWIKTRIKILGELSNRYMYSLTLDLYRINSVFTSKHHGNNQYATILY